MDEVSGDPMIPLYGFLQGDSLGLLILGQPDETIADLAQKLQRAADIRVNPINECCLVYKGQVLSPLMTVKAAGMGPLDRFDVVRRQGDHE